MEEGHRRRASVLPCEWWEGEGDSGEGVRKNGEKRRVVELNQRPGDIGVIQANTCEERRNLNGAEGRRVRFMGGGVTWLSTQTT